MKTDQTAVKTGKPFEPSLRQNKWNHTKKLMKANWALYLFLVPAVVYIGTFSYGPMYGIQLAFKTFVASKGIMGSPWVGLKWFSMFFSSARFGQILWNTISISLYSLLIGFPIPIILALILNNITNLKLKKFAQTVTYMPHFISVVVLIGMMSVFFSPNSGFVNTLLGALGVKPVYFMGEPSLFRHLYVWSGVWQSMGWSSIIYIAALSGVSPELHESAVIDGASRLRRIWHIDIPAIMPTMVILLILSCGQIMSVGYEKVYLMQNSLNLNVSEVISTYTYKIGLVQAEFGYSTAIGLFNNIINFTILLIVNKAAGRLSGSSLW